MNGAATNDDQSWPHGVSLCDAQKRLGMQLMNGAIMVFLVVVGGVSAFIFALSRRLEKRRAGWGPHRRSIAGSVDDDGPSTSRDNLGFASWFSAYDPGQHGDSCAVPDGGASGSSDSGIGGDTGGGGGGGDSCSSSD
jgi:hypothetical protein